MKSTTNMNSLITPRVANRPANICNMGGRAVINFLMLSLRYSILSFVREKSLFFRVHGITGEPLENILFLMNFWVHSVFFSGIIKA